MGIQHPPKTMTLLDTAVWLMATLLLVVLVCALFALFAGILCALIAIATEIFSYSGIDLWESLENRCHRAHRKHLLALVSMVAKSQTSLEDMNAQLDYLKRRDELATKASAFVQRDVYLAEQIEALQQQKNDERSTPSSTERMSTLKRYRQESQEISMKLHENWQKLKTLNPELLPHLTVGAWIREDMRRQQQKQPFSPADYHYDNRRDLLLICQSRNGCCAYDCGCCGKVRAFNEIQKERPAVYLYSHCTNECACCRRRERHVFGVDSEHEHLREDEKEDIQKLN